MGKTIKVHVGDGLGPEEVVVRFSGIRLHHRRMAVTVHGSHAYHAEAEDHPLVEHLVGILDFPIYGVSLVCATPQHVSFVCHEAADQGAIRRYVRQALTASKLRFVEVDSKGRALHRKNISLGQKIERLLRRSQ